MNKNTLRIIVIAGLINLVAAGILYFLLSAGPRKIAVVDAVKLFNSYQMKIDMEKAAGGRLEMFKRSADSLGIAMGQMKGQQAPQQQLQELNTAYQKAQMQMEQEYQSSNALINEAVWKRLNPLIDEYGRKNKFHLIIGANGMGSVLYNDNYYDKTEEVINYVNSIYNKNL